MSAADWNPIDFRSNCSMMLSIWSVVSPLCVGREAVHIDAAIVRDDRLRPFGRVSGEVGLRHPAADALEVTLDGVGDLAFVESVPPACRDQPERSREGRVAKHVAFTRRAPSGAQILRKFSTSSIPSPGVVKRLKLASM